MTPASKYDFKRVVDTLKSPSSSLRELAENSGFDVFSFYQKADLSGLDLSNQDLRGLNFSGANLKGSIGSNFEADEGAFNGGFTDSDDLSAYIDKFDCFLDDVLHSQAKFVYVFTQFRPGAIDESINVLRTTSQTIAEIAKLNVATVRKARRSQVVALESASAIAFAIKGLLQKLRTAERQRTSIVRQPMISILELPYGSEFRPISRERYATVLELSAMVNTYRNKHRPPEHEYLFRDSPAMLSWISKYYLERGEDPGWIRYPQRVEEPGPLFAVEYD